MSKKKKQQHTASKATFNETMNEFASESMSATEQKSLGKKAKQALDAFEKQNF